MSIIIIAGLKRVVVKRCVKCGRFKVYDACLICKKCTENLCIEEWGENWRNDYDL